MKKKSYPRKNHPRLKTTKPSASPPGGFLIGKVGSGITEKTVTTFSGTLNDEGLALLRETMDRVTTITGGDIEEMLRAFLREAGLPDDPTEAGKYPFRSHVTPELDEKGAYHSGTWYAAKVPDPLSSAKWYVILGEMDKGMDCMFDAARLYQQGIDKRLYEEDVLLAKVYRGTQHGKGKKRGDQQTTGREEKWKKMQTAAEKVWKQQRSWSKEAVAKMIQSQFPGESIRTIRRRIKKPSP